MFHRILSVGLALLVIIASSDTWAIALPSDWPIGKLNLPSSCRLLGTPEHLSITSPKFGVEESWTAYFRGTQSFTDFSASIGSQLQRSGYMQYVDPSYMGDDEKREQIYYLSPNGKIDVAVLESIQPHDLYGCTTPYYAFNDTYELHVINTSVPYQYHRGKFPTQRLQSSLISKQGSFSQAGAIR